MELKVLMEAVDAKANEKHSLERYASSKTYNPCSFLFHLKFVQISRCRANDLHTARVAYEKATEFYYSHPRQSASFLPSNTMHVFAINIKAFNFQPGC